MIPIQDKKDISRKVHQRRTGSRLIRHVDWARMNLLTLWSWFLRKKKKKYSPTLTSYSLWAAAWTIFRWFVNIKILFIIKINSCISVIQQRYVLFISLWTTRCWSIRPKHVAENETNWLTTDITYLYWFYYSLLKLIYFFVASTVL
jgi:hypothetical protein